MASGDVVECVNCALSETGGCCTMFEAHDGPKIAYLVDLQGLDAVRPNMPSDDEWRLVEDRLTAWHDQGAGVGLLGD